MKKEQVVALISIGQSPRPDIAADFLRICGDSFQILEIGALDELSKDEIECLAPGAGESDLITKLRDGQTVYLSHDRLIPHMQQAIRKAEIAGADWIVVACTGDFPALRSSVPLLLPNDVLCNSAANVLQPGDRLAVIAPTVGQISEAEERWTSRGYSVEKVMVESPFSDHQALMDILKNDEKVLGAKGLIADCFGFDLLFAQRVAEFYPKPIFLSRKLICHFLLSMH